MANFYGELLIRITSDTAGLSKGLASSAAQTNAAAKSMENAGKKARVSWERVGLGMQNVGRTMSQFVTIPIAAGFAFAAYSGYKYEKTLLQIRNLTGLTAGETQRYGEAMLNMSKYGIGPQKLAEAMYFISSSGFKASEALKVLDVSAKASASGMGDVQVVADVVTSALNSYGHGAYTAAEITDTLMRTVEVGKAEPEQLASSLGRILPIANQLGVGFSELGGNVAALTLGGLSSAESVTALRGAMVALVSPAKMSIEELKTMGLTYKDVTKSIADKGLLPTLKMLWEATDHNMLSMRKIIPNVRATTGVMSLLGANYKENLKVIDQVGDAQGKLNESFATTSITPIQKFRVAIASIQSSFIKMGAQIMPTIAGIISKIAGLLDAIGSLSPGWRGAIMWAGAFVAALGPIIMIAGSVIRSIALIKGALAGLAVVRSASFAFAAFTGGAATAAEAVGLFVASLGPVAIGLAAFAAVGAAVYGLTKLSDHLNGTTQRINDMRKAAELTAGDDSLRLWADRNLGGHLEQTGANEFVFRPRVEGDVNMLANWTRTAAAKARAVEKEESAKERVRIARGNRSKFAQMLHEEQLDLQGALNKQHHARTHAQRQQAEQQAEASRKRIAVLKQELAEQDRYLAKQQASLERTELKGKAMVYKVNIKEAKAKIKDVKKDLADVRDDLKKHPHNVNLQLKEERLQQKLERLEANLKRVTARNYQIKISMRIQSLEANLKTAEDRLQRLKNRYGGRGGVGDQYSPKISADITALEKFATRGEKRLADLNALIAEPTVTVDDVPALTALGNIQAGIDSLKGRSVSIIVNEVQGSKVPRRPKAWGGIFRKSTIVEVGEAGPEVILPLSKPQRMMELMRESGLTGDNAGKAGTAVARKAAATGARVAAAVAGAIGGAIGGSKKKNTEKLSNAADASGSIQTLVDFVAGISEALDKLNATTVPALAVGWKEKIRDIVRQAAKVSTLIAAEINKAFPWTKGKAKTKKKDAVDPKPGAKGTKLGQAAETSGPIGELVSFVGSIAEALDAVVRVTVPAITADVKVNVAKLVKAAAELATLIAKAINEALPRGISSTVSNNASAMSGIIDDLTSMVESLTDMTASAVNNAIGGAANVSARMPQLTESLKSMLAQFAYAMKGVTVSPELAAVSSAISQFVGEITGVVTALTDMTGKTLQDAIWGAGWLAYRAQDLAAALRQMLAQMSYAFRGFSTAGVNDLSAIMERISGLAGSTTAMFDSLNKLTGKATATGVASAQQIGGSFAGAVAVGSSNVTFNITVNAIGDISEPGVATQAGKDVGLAAIKMLARKTRANNYSQPRRRRR